MIRKPLIAFVLCATCVVLVTAMVSRTRHAEVQATPLAQASDGMGQSVVASTPPSASRMPLPGTTAGTPAEDDPDHDSQGLQAALAAQETKFQSEPVSARWAATQEQMIAGAFSRDQLAKDAAPAPISHSVTCRSATCRINAVYGDNMASTDAQISVLSHIAPTFPHTRMAEVPNPDGTVELILYADAGNGGPARRNEASHRF